LLALSPAVRAQAFESDSTGVEFFERKVRPILVEHCYKCHAATGTKVKGGLLMDSRAALLKGGDTGPVLVPGSPEKSRVIEAIGYKNVDRQMPPKGKLPDAVIADLTAWVKMGAPWPRETAATAGAKQAHFDIQTRKEAHWAWQPIRAYKPPGTKDANWARLPIDAFIQAGLEVKGMKPNPAADRRTLLRRVTFDLIGLPPTAQEIDAFLTDESPRAFENVVDRLLASPRFGERWARHWLDLVRYAESRGHENDYTTPNAYQFRDYVIRALNADVPYNQFVTEHLAGDLLGKPRLDPREGFNESILGTGFWLLGEEVHSPVDPRQDEADRFDNRLDVMTKTFLALTVSCARCHDHKFDAISSKDYYALLGFLESSSYRLARFDSAECNRRVAADLARLRERARPDIHQAIAAVMHDVLEHLTDYLLAAREGVLTCKAITKQAESAMDCRKLDAIAEARGLRPDVLRAWVAHLRSAAQDSRDVFHAFAKLALDAGAIKSRESEAVNQLLTEMRHQVNQAKESLQTAEVIIDYAKCRPNDWLPDDSGFGPAPSRPGDVHLSGGAKQPIVRLTERDAAAYDRAWDGLRLSTNSENDPGALSARVRAGRSIRTPSFTVSKGKLYYLARGVGQAYAAVDQHAVILGPLHAHLVLGINTGGKYQWVCHDLTAYKGHPAHVEFTAAGGAEFEIAMVVQANLAPAECDDVKQALLDAVTNPANASPVELASAYQRLFQDAAKCLDTGRMREVPRGATFSRLANWVLSHPELRDARTESCTQLAETAGKHIAARNRQLTAIKQDSRLALAMQDGSGVDERVFIRGSTKALGKVAPRRFLDALAGPDPLPIKHGSGRLELARQMTDPAINPLLPRVMVNRVWHHVFGRGIVASVDNFGVLGDAPTHPELLDYLAQRFVHDGWSVKKLIRALVLTNTYQMSSQPTPDAEFSDSQDLLLHRMRVRRLEGEAIRDSLLAVSGRLNPRMYGPAVPVHLTPFLDGRGRPESGPLDGNGRRNLYLAVRRNFLSPLLLTFDTPIPFSTVGRRTVSNVPAQALILLNDPFVHQQAELWARRVLAQPGNAADRITGMYVDALGRPPSASELTACVEFLERQSRLRQAKPDDLAPWQDLAHALFNTKEFIFLN
jgi:hypothetical protein